MGGCLGSNRRESAENANSTENGSRPNSASARKNHPLCHEVIRWKSDVPLTEGQLRSKRDEFWDTAPAFEGRKEIWDALRAASVALEVADYQLAQAILDGAGISVPNGFLTECYDELGTRYQVPVYCLSYPLNIVKEGSGRDSPSELIESAVEGKEIPLKIRLSHNSHDVKLTLLTTDTIAVAKKKLQIKEGIDPCTQRWFFGGKLLGDKVHIDEIKVLPGYVIQVIINSEQYK
ncbi:ubiquitin domain-containing protein 1 [Planococcus citri]|uniref:ubiquitin domain-containing protein 1 n=1 Tax=Planococcus citri TaxID=170843 RepID=UPI0031F82882